MKRFRPADIDTRGFRWPLLALERRRELALDEAALRLSDAARAQAALQAELACAEAAFADQVAGLAQPPAAAIDPALRRDALSYLAVASVGMQVKRQEIGCAELRSREERLRLQHADRELRAVGKLREGAIAAFTVQKRRVQAKEADLAWLARAFASRRTAG